jgi:hypothetical protein
LKISKFACAFGASLTLTAAAQAAPPPVEVYGALPSVEMMRLSPNGDRIAWISVSGADRKLHVTTDTVVPPQQSIEMADALKKAGKPFEIQVMPGEDHWLSRGATRTGMLKAAVDFVEKHNPPD